MNILVIIPKTFAGCGFYRMYQPHNHLAKNYPVKITFASSLRKSEISAYTDEEIRDFDIVVWHKTLFSYEDIRRVKSLGVPTVIDFDDHWKVGREHTLYREYSKEGLTAKLHKLLLLADYVTCTTDELADEIYLHNQNVVVLENAVDRGYEGWKVGRIPEDKYVFGYLGGPCHTRDVALLRQVPAATKAHFRLFGYNGTEIYKFYAGILSEGKNFSLFPGANIFDYPQFYNRMDVSLVPLEGTEFNSMKSELKLIEAGAFRKAVIVSRVKPYTKIIRHGYNCLAAESKKDWIDFIKTLNLNHNYADDLGAALEEDTRKYDISVVNQKRYNFYKDVYEKHHTDSSHEPGGVVVVERQ